MIKDEIKNILSKSVGVQVYVYVEEKNDEKEKEKKTTKVKILNANDNLRKALSDKLKDKLEKNFLDNEQIQFNEFNEFEEGKDSYLLINRKEFTELDSICSLDNIDEYFLDSTEKILGFIFKFGNASNYAIIFEKCYPINLIKKRFNANHYRENRTAV